MASPKQSKKIKPPKGTRDLYPEDLLRQRYITNAWRDASIRCGFEEIAGPTFESTDLYAVKSGDGILNELFQTFSGKGGSETLDKLVEKGKADFALRPEFTPTLARMYAAHAKQLPKPCKWFTAGPYFRAERPQRGRLREFLQWNCDIIGVDTNGPNSVGYGETMDAELFGVVVDLLRSLGISYNQVRLHFTDRRFIVRALLKHGITEDKVVNSLNLLDMRGKIRAEEFNLQAHALGLDVESFDKEVSEGCDTEGFLGANSIFFTDELQDALGDEDYKWYRWDSSVVRGLAYYTGTVFEAIADGERAVAGGGRYDNLIELFGGPPTPACGFGMGDVVLGNLLDDKALMPEGLELKEAVARPQASIRPQAFIVPNRESDNSETNEPLVHTLTANLRRGIESESWLADENRKPWNKNRYALAPLHARISYKSTTKLNKLRDDAIKQHAKFFVIIDDENTAQLHNLDTKESLGPFSPDPASQSYIGKAIAGATA